MAVLTGIMECHLFRAIVQGCANLREATGKNATENFVRTTVIMTVGFILKTFGKVQRLVGKSVYQPNMKSCAA